MANKCNTGILTGACHSTGIMYVYVITPNFNQSVVQVSYRNKSMKMVHTSGKTVE